VLGRHDGIIHFTVGQRRGLGISAGSPLYVVRLDAASRRVVVGPREALRTSRIRLRDLNWLGDGSIDETIERQPEIYVKVRSTRPPQAAWLRRGADAGLEVELIGGEDGVSPGQACVFYDAAEGQARVLGGGFIAGTMPAAQAVTTAAEAFAAAK
jgi:tRNA-specific 2-thiouridylase